ncbi:lamin tail domain-containing protein, partial [Halococcus hamelinensis]
PTTRLPSTTRTPSRPPTATAAGNGSGSRALALASVDAANETVLLRNAGQRRVNLDGYAVDFDDGQRYALPPYSLGAGANVTVHTGRGDDTRGDLYAGFLYPVINDGGDTVLVEAPNGRIVAAERVGGN